MRRQIKYVMVMLVVVGCASWETTESAKILKKVSRRSKQMDVCFSPFKCDETMDELDRKMERSHFRFGNFPAKERTCIVNGVKQSYSNAGRRGCVSYETLERSITEWLGYCIKDIHMMRDAEVSRQKVLRQSTVSGDDNADDESSVDLAVSVRTAKADAPLEEEVVDGEEVANEESAGGGGLLERTKKMPYGSPIRRVARFMKLENTSERQFSFSCTSGRHWCCVFIGDDQSFSCFSFWCGEYIENPKYKLKCY